MFGMLLIANNNVNNYYYYYYYYDELFQCLGFSCVLHVNADAGVGSVCECLQIINHGDIRSGSKFCVMCYL